MTASEEIEGENVCGNCGESCGEELYCSDLCRKEDIAAARQDATYDDWKERDDA